MDNNPKGAAAVPAPIKAAAAVQGELWLLLCSPAIQPSARGGNPPPLLKHEHTDTSLACLYLFTTFQNLLLPEPS